MRQGPKPKLMSCGSLASFALHTNAYAYEETNEKTVVPRVVDTDSHGRFINADKKQWTRVTGFYSSLNDYFDPSQRKAANLEIRAYSGMYVELENRRAVAPFARVSIPPETKLTFVSRKSSPFRNEGEFPVASYKFMSPLKTDSGPVFGPRSRTKR